MLLIICKLRQLRNQLSFPNYVASDVTMCELLNLSKPHLPLL